MSSMRQLTHALKTVVEGEAETKSAASAAFQSLSVLFQKMNDVHRESSELVASGALAGTAADEVATAAHRWAVARQQVAEVWVLLSAISPVIQWQPNQTVIAAARSGATEKRLAEWEQEWLRSEVVTVLAGDKP